MHKWVRKVIPLGGNPPGEARWGNRPCACLNLACGPNPPNLVG